MYSSRAHMAVENHGILEYGAMQDSAHSRTMFVHNASDCFTMKNIAVSANYENQLSWTSKVEEENDKLTQKETFKVHKVPLAPGFQQPISRGVITIRRINRRPAEFNCI